MNSLNRYLTLIKVLSASKATDQDVDLVRNDCGNCRFKRDVPGNSHIQCVKPDPDMTGNQHGIKEGWFMYPILFDPTWCTAKCKNYESTELVSLVSKSSGKPE